MSKSAERIFRPLWLVLGLLSVATGIVGVFLPVIPTTPLMILAAFSFPKALPDLKLCCLTTKLSGRS